MIKRVIHLFSIFIIIMSFFPITLVAKTEKETNTFVPLSNIYTENLEVVVSYSTQQLTNQSVVVTMIANQSIVPPEGWIQENDKTFSKQYDENISEILIIEALTGTSCFVEINISNIDKIAPVATMLSYSTTEKTSEDIIVTMVVDEEILDMDGWIKVSQSDTSVSYQKKYQSNINETITIIDLAENSSIVEIHINNIGLYDTGVAEFNGVILIFVLISIIGMMLLMKTEKKTIFKR